MSESHPASRRVPSLPYGPPTVTASESTVEVVGPAYRWCLDRATGRLQVADGVGRPVLRAPAVPLVVRGGRGDDSVGNDRRTPTAGTAPITVSVDPASANGPQLTIESTGDDPVRVRWRFDADGWWSGPAEYPVTGSRADIVAVHWFCESVPGAEDPVPALSADYLVQPGVSGSPVLGSVIDLASKVRVDSWLGRGCCTDPDRISQQWGLPSHYIAFFGIDGHPNTAGAHTRHRSSAVCIGLADIPAADVRTRTVAGRFALTFDIRGDLWRHLEPGRQELGAGLRWSMGSDYRDAIDGYAAALIAAGAVRPRSASTARDRVVTASQFNPWGAQLAIGAAADRLDQRSLDSIYADLRASGLRPEMFVVDDMWQEHYGPLRHSTTRLPRFVEFLDRLRADGLRVGIWAAFLRCSDPALLGLTADHLLRDAAGDPIGVAWGAGSHYLLDVSQPAVARTLTEHIGEFVRTYRPDLVKFDFGYELPTLAQCLPADPRWAGERFLANSLQVITEALRVENPDVAVMYYSLSPLYLPWVDQHSTDDVWQSVGEYPAQCNKRIFFGSVLARWNTAVYGSGGYTWHDMDQVWFDSACAGPPGSLGSFGPDQFDSTLTPRLVAAYNGIAAIVRRNTGAVVEPVDRQLVGASTAPRAGSWIRREGGQVVMIALRPDARCGPHDPVGAGADGGLGAGVHSDAQVVVASMDDRPLAAARRLGVVPLADGTLRLHRDGSTTGIARYHHAGGPPVERQVRTVDGQLLVPLLVCDTVGQIEWIEVLTDP